MGKTLSVAAWVMCGLGLLAAFGRSAGVPDVAIGAFLFLAAILGGTSIVITRHVELAGRFGGRVPITGTAAVLIGLGMIVVPIGGLSFFLATRYNPGPTGRVWGGLAIFVLGVGLFLAGAGMWIKFALEPWRASRGEATAQRALMLIGRTWAFGWIGLVGAGLMIAGLFTAIKSVAHALPIP